MESLQCLIKETKRRGLGRMSMTSEQYQLARSLRGTQKEVAEYLRVARLTITRRETGKIAITHEATLALLTMPPKATPGTTPHQTEAQTIFGGMPPAPASPPSI